MARKAGADIVLRIMFPPLIQALAALYSRVRGRECLRIVKNRGRRRMRGLSCRQVNHVSGLVQPAAMPVSLFYIV